MSGPCQSEKACIAASGDPNLRNPGASVWHCGTLTYTKMGLVSLFAFMIWGDFCNALMQAVVPSIMPLKFKELGASNMLIGLFASSIPALMSVLMNPYISFKSDRHRSRWGRRIPFILFTIPPLCLSLAGLAFGVDLAQFLSSNFLSHYSPTAIAIVTLGILLVVFLSFDQFINAVFCGLFNDVVPAALMGRFMGTMRIVGSSVSFLYNYFIFQYAETHMREIFLGASVLYFFGIGAMCLFVKEGEYPMPTEDELKSARGLTAIKSYFKESFSHKFYWTKFAYTATSALSYGGLTAFMVFFYKEMGLSLGDIGKVSAITSIALMGTAYFGAVFVDRWHPIRITVYSAILSTVFIVANFVWLFITISPEAFFWLHMLGAGLIGAVSNSVTNVAAATFDMRLHPHSRFTQFCSAQALLRCACVVVGGVIVGLYFDGLKGLFPHSDYAYRFWFLWSVTWNAIAAVFAYKLYRQWHQLGGDKAFRLPAIWSETGYEEQSHTPFVGPQSNWLKVDLALIHSVMALSVVYLAPLSYVLWKRGWIFDLEWHLFIVIPLAVTIYLWWLHIERSLKADIVRCQMGEAPRNGIPHHGILFLKSLALLLLLGVWFGKTFVAYQDGLEGGILALGCGNLATNALFIGAFLLLRRMECGHASMLDYDGRKEVPAEVQPLTQSAA